MLSQAALSHEHLGFAPLPDNARQAVYDSLTACGFAREAILELYNFTGRDGDFTLNMLAFADRVRRNPAEYAGCTVYNATNGLPDREIVSVLAQTAAPFHIIHREDRFSFWATTLEQNKINPIDLGTKISYAQLSQVLQEYKVDLAPDQLVSVKQGRSQFAHPHLRPLEPLQLALWAIDVTRDTLVDTFGRAVTQLRADMNDRPDPEITGLAIRMLGAMILADTGTLDASMRQRRSNLSFDQLLLHPNVHVFAAIRNRSNTGLLCTQATSRCVDNPGSHTSAIHAILQAHSHGSRHIRTSRGCPCAGTIIVELGNQVTVLQPNIAVHINQIILPFLTSHQCRI